MKNETRDVPESTEEQQVDQPGDQEASLDQPQSLDLPDNAVNLVPFLLDRAKVDKKVEDFVKKDLPEQVVRDFNEDWRSREAWMAKRKDRVNLWLGNLKPKTEPWKDCANMHVPILATRTLRLVSRVWSEIFAQGQPIFSAQVSSAVDMERADTITKHENWQFAQEVPAWPVHVYRALIEFFRDGDAIFKSYRDIEGNINRHEYKSPDVFVYSYERTTTAPDMSDVSRKTEILFPYKRDLLRMAKSGEYAQVEEIVKEDGTHDIDLDEVVKDAVDSFEGKDRKERTSDAPYWLLEQHTWVKLPHTDEEAPFRVVVDGRSRNVLGLYSRYYDDPDDRVRFDRETVEFQQFAEDTGRYMEILSKEQDLLIALQTSAPPQEAMVVAQQVQAERPAPPVQPTWMELDEAGSPRPPKPCRQKVIEQFSHAACIENPEGSHGLGVGMLLMPHQMAANIAANQFIDAATLANGLRLIKSDNVKFPPGTTSISPNEILTVKGVPQDDMAKSFYRIEYPPANNQLLQMVQQQEEAADSISSAPDVLSGEKDGQETFRGMATRVEQATKQLSALASKFMVALNQVAKNNALLNFWFLPEPDKPKTVDARDPATGKLTPVEVSRDMYRDTYEVAFAADLSFASHAAKIAESDDALMLLLKGLPPPVLTQVFKLEGIALALRKCFQARGLFDLASYVRSEQEIAMAIQQQMMAMQGGPPGPGGPPGAGPPGAPPPSIPDGQPAPGTSGPGPQTAEGTPREAAPNVR